MREIKLKNIESLGWNSALRGMRNPMESWDKNDSSFGATYYNETKCDISHLGANDMKLALQLIKAGPSHRKFLRQIMISVDITANLKFWDEFDTYLHTVKNSTSQMHKLGTRKLTHNDFSDNISPLILDIVNEKIEIYQNAKKNLSDEETKNAWRYMIVNIPQSFMYTRTTTMSYEVFLTMYNNRKHHKMIEWRIFCSELKKSLPHMDRFISKMNEKFDYIKDILDYIKTYEKEVIVSQYENLDTITEINMKEYICLSIFKEVEKDIIITRSVDNNGRIITRGTLDVVDSKKIEKLLLKVN